MYSLGNSRNPKKVLVIHHTQVRVVCFYVYINVRPITKFKNWNNMVKIDSKRRRARQC